MNNKGYAITSVIYGILLVFLLVVFATLSVLITRGNTLNKIKKNALNTITGEHDSSFIPYYVADFSRINVTNDASTYGTVDYNTYVISPYGYDISNTVSSGNIEYSITDGGILVDSFTRSVLTGVDPLVTNYDYVSKIEKIMLEPGVYKLEVWGGKTVAAAGTYASGYITLSKRTILYVNVGGASSGNKNGYNGGVTSISYDSSSTDKLIASNNIFGASMSNTSYYDDECSNDNAVSNCKKNGSGYVKISSLVYITK